LTSSSKDKKKKKGKYKKRFVLDSSIVWWSVFYR
jgi:hypothetical protein